MAWHGMGWDVMTAADNSNEEGTVCTLRTSVDDDSATHIHDLNHRHHHHHHHRHHHRHHRHHRHRYIVTPPIYLCITQHSRLSQRHQQQHQQQHHQHQHQQHQQQQQH
jgi:hypothetical protein